MTNWSKFDKEFDTKGLQEEIKEAAENDRGGYEDVPDGDYEVSVEKLELKESRKGDPMLSVWFNILDGKFTNSKIFMNQVLTKGFQIHNANELLRSLGTDLDIKFDSFAQYAELIDDVFEQIDSDGLEYLLDYGTNKKGYNTFKIKEVYSD